MEGIAAAGVIISAIELLVLYLAYQYGRAQWQPMFVLIVELLAYANQIISPGAEYSVMRLANGGTVEWLRYCGWLATCPVLLMFLVSMTTFAPRGTAQAPVRLVPLLISNQLMILLGITAAACTRPLKWYFFGLAGVFGGIVFVCSFQCFVALHAALAHIEGNTVAARRLVVCVGICFVGGWSVFPVFFALGRSGALLLSKESEVAGYFVGDLLSKNLFVISAAACKHYYMDGELAGAPPATPRTLASRIVAPLRRSAEGRLRVSHARHSSRRASLVPSRNGSLADALVVADLQRGSGRPSPGSVLSIEEAPQQAAATELPSVAEVEPSRTIEASSAGRLPASGGKPPYPQATYPSDAAALPSDSSLQDDIEQALRSRSKADLAALIEANRARAVAMGVHSKPRAGPLVRVESSGESNEGSQEGSFTNEAGTRRPHTASPHPAPHSRRPPSAWGSDTLGDGAIDTGTVELIEPLDKTPSESSEEDESRKGGGGGDGWRPRGDSGTARPGQPPRHSNSSLPRSQSAERRGSTLERPEGQGPPLPPACVRARSDLRRALQFVTSASSEAGGESAPTEPTDEELVSALRYIAGRPSRRGGA